MRRFELVEGKSSKYWEIDRDGATVTTRWGRIGTAGRDGTKSYASDAEAQVEEEKAIRGKVAKGYAEVGVEGSATRGGAPLARPPKAAAYDPSMPMDEAGFWSVIALFDWKKTGDDDAVVEPAVAALAARSVQDICKFEEIMTEKLYALDGEAWARRIGECAYDGDESHFSVDEFLYARCAEVASGVAHFSKVLANPKKIQKDTEFESLLYVAQTAHRRKTGKEELPITTERSYETFANGQQWKR